MKEALERLKSVPPRPAAIDTMILEELQQFTSLDSKAGVPIEEGELTLSPDNEGSRPLDASEFVDPSNWFEGDQDVEHAIENVRNSAPAGATMGWFETKDDNANVRRPAAVPMGPSLNPPEPVSEGGGAQPVMTFRPPGATPIAIKENEEAEAATTAKASALPTETPKPPSKGGGKAIWIILGVAALAAAGVAIGWFITQ